MDTALIVILLMATLQLVLLAVAILTGWGDGLIAGYNTAKEEERQQYNIKRLRAVVATILLFTVVFIWCVPLIGEKLVFYLVALPVFFVVLIGCIILANTWCKKK